ncbi:MAG: hypothetical protein HOO96_06065 [Polyangiaceae bacterium]|nr:hypothetical protein [Polyangiaceae bacterium]
MRPVSSWPIVVGVGALLSCQALISSTETQCDTDADCAAHGSAFAGTRCENHVCRTGQVGLDGGAEAGDGAVPVDPSWACVGKVQWSTQSVTEKVKYHLRFARLIGGTPIVGLHGKACGSLDPECTTPFAQANTDANGEFELEIPLGFRGNVHLPAGPSTFPTMAPTLVAVYPPPDKDVLTPFADITITPVSLDELNYLLSQVKSAADPNLGHVFGVALDCNNQRAAGVSLSSSAKDVKTVQYYYQGADNPTVTAQGTDVNGNAGFLNLPPGVVTLETRPASLGTKRSGSYGLLVKKATVTIVYMVPTP